MPLPGYEKISESKHIEMWYKPEKFRMIHRYFGFLTDRDITLYIEGLKDFVKNLLDAEFFDIINDFRFGRPLNQEQCSRFAASASVFTTFPQLKFYQISTPIHPGHHLQSQFLQIARQNEYDHLIEGDTFDSPEEAEEHIDGFRFDTGKYPSLQKLKSFSKFFMNKIQ